MIAAPQVSILVPIYNVERYLEQCLDSIVSQSFEDFEAICINDGSTDGSRSIVQRYLEADARFRVIDKANSGYGASMNQGLRAARGEFVAILESDDFFESDALATLHDLAVREGADVAKGNFWFYWSTPAERRELFEFVDGDMDRGAVHPLEVPQVFYRKPSIWSALYRRSFLMENEIEFLETPGASYQDAGFNFKVWACARRIACTRKALLSYRQDNESSSVNSPSKVFCVCDEYEEMQRFLDGRDDLRAKLQGVLERMKFDTYSWNYDRLSPELRAEFLPRFSEEFARDLDRGIVDMNLFEPWAAATLHAVVERPQAFERSQRWPVGKDKLSTLRHFYALGGVPLVCSILFGTSSRA